MYFNLPVLAVLEPIGSVLPRNRDEIVHDVVSVVIAVHSGVIFNVVEAKDHPHAHCQPKPHQNVAERVVVALHREKHSHTGALEQHEKNRQEKLEREAENVFVKHGRQQEDKQLRQNFVAAGDVLVQIFVDIKIKPVMYDDVPCAVVNREVRGIPPVAIKFAVGEPQNLCCRVHPRVQNTVEAAKEAEKTR